MIRYHLARILARALPRALDALYRVAEVSIGPGCQVMAWLEDRHDAHDRWCARVAGRAKGRS